MSGPKFGVYIKEQNLVAYTNPDKMTEFIPFRVISDRIINGEPWTLTIGDMVIMFNQ